MNSLANSVSECQKINLNNRLTQSYERFLQRLKTFELFRWFGKPADFSPIECARRGWINLSRDTLKCVSCSNIFYHYSQSSLTMSKHQTSLSDENFKKTVFAHDPKELVEKHNKNCPWRTLCVSDKLIQVDIYDEDRIYETFLKRIDSYKKCHELPVLAESVMSQLDSRSARLVPIHDSSNKQKYKINRNAFILACCGWTYNANLNVVTCEKCLRSVGLWLYKTEPNLFDDKKLKQQQEHTESRRTLELLAQLSHVEDNEVNYLSETQPYSSELVIENLIKNMIKCIEVNEQDELKHRSSQRKRKLTDGDDDVEIEEASASKRMKPEDARRRSSSKLFDAMSEHFSYCPWLKAEHDILATSDHKRNTCQLHSDIIQRHLSKLERKDQKDDDSAAVVAVKIEPDLIQLDDSVLRAKYKSTASFTSDEISNRIKSVQSLLINCASQCSFGQMTNKTN